MIVLVFATDKLHVAQDWINTPGGPCAITRSNESVYAMVGKVTLSKLLYPFLCVMF